MFLGSWPLSSTLKASTLTLFCLPTEDLVVILGLPKWLSSKESTCNAGAAGDTGSIPGSGRFPGEGSSNPLQYSCLENIMDLGAWQATVHRVTKSQTRLQRLTMHTVAILGLPGIIQDNGPILRSRIVFSHSVISNSFRPHEL